MKKYLVIGNPIQHSLSPKLHNHWIKENNINAIYDKKLLDENNIDAVYDKKQLNESDIEGVVDDIRNDKNRWSKCNCSI